MVLIPPSSPEYAALLSDIQKRLANPLPGSPPPMPDFEDPDAPTMVLCNRSQKAIAAVSRKWKFEGENGRTTHSSILISTGTSLLVPFGLDERLTKLYGYWHVILPGSKRGIRGGMFGDNTDVRPLQPDELWKGGMISGGGGRRSDGPLKSITLSLDGVSFLDGGFVGPDTLGNFDGLSADIDAHLQAARIARNGHNNGIAPTTIFAQIEAVTGPGPGPAQPPPPGGGGDFLKHSLRSLAFQISAMRRQLGDEPAIYQLMAWTETAVPQLHKL